MGVGGGGTGALKPRKCPCGSRGCADRDGWSGGDRWAGNTETNTERAPPGARKGFEPEKLVHDWEGYRDLRKEDTPRP